MNPQTSDPVAWSGRYDFAPNLTAMNGVPIPTWSTRSLTARWSRSAAARDLQTDVLQADLTDQDQSLLGAIRILG